MPGRADVVVAASCVVQSRGELGPGWLHIRGGVIADVGHGEVPESALDAEAVIERLRGTLVPGFVDIHCHGGAGRYFDQVPEDPEAGNYVRSAHLAAGTTTLIASLVTAPEERLRRQVAALSTDWAAGRIAGIHLEGPCLSRARSGAHDRRHLRDADQLDWELLLEAARGALRVVTIAPELPGALAATRRLVAQGVTVAIGHTDATADQVNELIDAGGSIATHIFNGMRPAHHQDPGPVFAALADARVSIELILDGHHVAYEAAEVVRLAAGDRLTLVSDAMSAAGMPDGDYALGGLAVRVAGGAARLVDGGSLAGSTLTLSRAAQRLVHTHRATLTEMVRAASTRPARAVGLTDRGDLAPGLRADMVLLDDELQVQRTMVAGRWAA